MLQIGKSLVIPPSHTPVVRIRRLGEAVHKLYFVDHRVAELSEAQTKDLAAALRDPLLTSKVSAIGAQLTEARFVYR